MYIDTDTYTDIHTDTDTMMMRKLQYTHREIDGNRKTTLTHTDTEKTRWQQENNLYGLT